MEAMFVQFTPEALAILERAKAKLLAQAECYPEGCVINSDEYGLDEQEQYVLVACGLLIPKSDEYDEDDES